jgi:hypothetical protein
MLESLKEGIWNAVGNIIQEQLESVWQEAEYCFDVCRATNGMDIDLH